MPLPGRAALPLLAGVAVLILALPAAAGQAAPAPAAPAAHHSKLLWTQVYPKRSPGARDQSEMAYDPPLHEVVLFGGYNYTYFDYNDTWAYKGGHWINLTARYPVTPAPRWGAGLVYDPALKGLVLFGGRTFTGYYNDTWLFNKSGWHLLNVTGAPSPRAHFGLAYDPALDGIVLYGGAIGTSPTGTGLNGPPSNQTWLLKGSSWSNLTRRLTTNPGRMADFDLAYDVARGQLIGFGGGLYVPSSGSYVYPNGTWALGSGGWSQLFVGRAAPATGSEPGGLVWDPACGCLVQFGAGGHPGPVGNETWELKSGGWKNVSSTAGAPPEARGCLAMAYDADSKLVLLFGGDQNPSGYNYLGDTWTLS